MGCCNFNLSGVSLGCKEPINKPKKEYYISSDYSKLYDQDKKLLGELTSIEEDTFLDSMKLTYIIEDPRHEFIVMINRSQLKELK